VFSENSKLNAHIPEAMNSQQNLIMLKGGAMGRGGAGIEVIQLPQIVSGGGQLLINIDITGTYALVPGHLAHTFPAS
jgi:hypothetical protein